MAGNPIFNPAGGGSSDATSIIGIPVVGSPSDGDVLSYHAGSDQWQPGPVSGGGGYSPGTPPTFEQFAHSTGIDSVTFGAAPANGDYLVAMSFGPASGAPAAGWTTQLTNSSGTDYCTIFTKVCGAGESATQTPSVGLAGDVLVMWNLSNQSGAQPFVTAISQGEQVGTTNQAVLAPNLGNCISLAAVSAIAGNITAAYNVGTQDVLDNSGARAIVAGHTDLSLGPMCGIFVNLSGNLSTKGATVIIAN